ncbi:hypothetical protein GN958_ATG02443 [Phytophthora infestans]|uniref:Uncharacterized protein n=1 Tax=Phytophthora infestans TaxID=4787 RepID=A0A8S9VAH7_PHYIN|nr:hypothetical protein GN958_ATG02443 [Phytophthora infestans]
MKNIGEDCSNGGDSGDTRDIKPLAYQQETPRSAASVRSEKPSQTTAWRPPPLALVSTHVGFEDPGEVLVEWSLDLWNCPEAHRDLCDVVSERVMEHSHVPYARKDSAPTGDFLVLGDTLIVERPRCSSRHEDHEDSARGTCDREYGDDNHFTQLLSNDVRLHSVRRSIL